MLAAERIIDNQVLLTDKNQPLEQSKEGGAREEKNDWAYCLTKDFGTES